MMKFIRWMGQVLPVLAVLLIAGVAWGDTSSEVLVINKGTGGYTTVDGLRHFNYQVVEVKPDYLILYFGLNDALNSRKLVKPQAYQANLQQMIDRAKKLGIKKIVLVTPNPIVPEDVASRHPTHPAKDHLVKHLDQYVQIVRELAAKNNLPLADLHKRITDLGTKKLVRNRANNRNYPDGVHLKPKGYQAFAKLVAPIFKNIIKPGDVVVCFGDSVTYGAGMIGQGTIFGQTYPAWLSVYLNRMAGVRDLAKPPAPPKAQKGIFAANGNFENSADRVHPDHWKLWNQKNQFEGTLTLIKEESQSQSGQQCVRVVNDNPKAAANLLSLKTIRVKEGQKLQVTWWCRGAGSLWPQVSLYSKGKFLRAIPNAKDQAHRILTSKWVKHEYTFEIPEKTKRIRLSFRITGEAWIDSIHLATAMPTPPAAALNLPTGKKLSNNQIKLAFFKIKDGGGIQSIRNAKGYEFLAPRKPSPLWKIQLRRLPSDIPPKGYAKLSLDPEQNDRGTKKDDGAEGNEILILNSLAAAKKKVEQQGHTLTFTWKALDVGTEKGVLDVTVKAKLLPGDRYARFTASFKNRSKKYTVFYLFAPMVDAIFPKDGKLNQDHLATPVFLGRLIQNPIQNGLLGKPSRLQPNRSGHSMQFDAYYHGDQGLYLGCFDPDQNVKRYALTTDPQNGLGWSIAHVPDNMKQLSQSWTVPYETVIGCFTGDWYDAAMLYRDWALKQSWAAKGPLVTRKDIPLWFKEMDEWFIWGPQKNMDLLFDPKLLEAFKGLNLGTLVCYWARNEYWSKMSPDLFPMNDPAKAYMKSLKDNQFRTMGYIQGICWDVEEKHYLSQQGKEHTVRNYVGQPVVWDFSKKKKEPHVAAIAHPGKLWEKVLGDAIVKMGAAGFDGIYLDSNNHAGTYMNFNPNYGQQVGGGNTYIKANRAMMRQMKTRAREKNPDTIFTAESFWEGNMAELDAYLTVNTTNQYIHKSQTTAIPLANAVYHDHAIFYACWLSRHDVQENDMASYLAKTGQGLVWGIKPGWEEPTFLLTFINHEKALEASIKRHRAYAAGRDFLVYGRMLRQPAMQNTLPMVDFDWFISFSKRSFPARLPAVLHSAWREPSGKLAVVFYNITDKPQRMVISLDDKQHFQGRTGKTATATPIYPVDAKPLSLQRKDGQWVLDCTIEARSPRLFYIDLR